MADRAFQPYRAACSIGSVLLAATLGVLAPLTAARAAPPRWELVLASRNEDGAKQNSHAESPSLSAEGTKVAFDSNATNLDPRDTDNLMDVYVMNLVTGGLTLASTSDAGIKGNGESTDVSISDDGTRVAFMSVATNLDPGDLDWDSDIYVKDLVTGDLTLASTSDDGTKGDGNSFSPSIAGEGMKVAFTSWAANLDPRDRNGATDVFVKDLASGNVTLASAGSRGEGNSGSDTASLSGNGRWVSFTTWATNFDPRDTDTVPDVYVKELATRRLILVSVTAEGVKGNMYSDHSDVSASGRLIAFETVATNLDPRDRDDVDDVYVKDVRTGDLTLASTSGLGVKGNGSSDRASLSGEGARVAFMSNATNLLSTDRDGISDVYLKELATGDVRLASTSDAGRKGNAASVTPALDARGREIAFDSLSTNLDPIDRLQDHDIYVKHIP